MAGTVPCAERFKASVRPMSAGKKRVCTGGTRRGMGSSAYVWIAEITSGSAWVQQGLTATCKDWDNEPQAKGHRAGRSGA
jgi:hypothetical protein